MRSLILAFTLVGCGSGQIQDHIIRTDIVDKRTPKVEEEFVPHVEKFKQIYKVDFQMLIEWATLEEKVMGVCYSWSDGHREIQIDDVKWSNLTYEGQEELIFHELGHCVFNLDHNEETMSMGDWTKIPVSIMYPYIFGDMPYYSEFSEHYYRQLGNAR